MKEIQVTVVYNSFLAELVYNFLLWYRGFADKTFCFGNTVYTMLTETTLGIERMNECLIRICQYNELGFFGFLNKYYVREFYIPSVFKTLEMEAFRNADNAATYISEKWPNFKLEIRGG